MLEELEGLIFLVSIAGAFVGVSLHWLGGLHTLYYRGNPAPGIVRAGIMVAMVWILYVLLFRADPSVTGLYILFYLVMGFAAIKLLGQGAAALFGVRSRIDIGERRNVAAAIVMAGFVVATGLIFGGSLWGEADPVGDDVGGWWIPVTFFLLGWGTLIGAFVLYLKGEGGVFHHRIRRERSIADARAAAVFLIAAGLTLADAVGGDFWGWGHGLVTFGFLALLLIVHTLLGPVLEEDGTSRRRESDPRRLLESGAYAAIALLVWGANRFLDIWLRGG